MLIIEAKHHFMTLELGKVNKLIVFLLRCFEELIIISHNTSKNYTVISNKLVLKDVSDE